VKNFIVIGLLIVALMLGVVATFGTNARFIPSALAVFCGDTTGKLAPIDSPPVFQICGPDDRG
jgi:hypothetical protein